MVHPTRAVVAMESEDNHAYVRQADVLLFHEGLGRLLCRQRTDARRHGGIHTGWTRRIQGGEGVNGEAVGWRTMKHRMAGSPCRSSFPVVSIEARRAGKVQCRRKAAVLAAHNLLAHA